MDAIGLRTEVDGATYARVRFTSLSAQVLRSNTGKGRLIINVDIALRNAEGPDLKAGEHRYISSIKVQLFGVPHEVAEKADAIAQAAFKVEVDVAAIISWDKEPSAELVNSQDCAARLARPLFMLAAVEVRGLAAKLGFNGLNFEVDLQSVLANPLNTVVEEREPKLKASPKPKPKPKPTPKKVAKKPAVKSSGEAK